MKKKNDTTKSGRNMKKNMKYEERKRSCKEYQNVTISATSWN